MTPRKLGAREVESPKEVMKRALRRAYEAGVRSATRAVRLDPQCSRCGKPREDEKATFSFCRACRDEILDRGLERIAAAIADGGEGL